MEEKFSRRRQRKPPWAANGTAVVDTRTGNGLQLAAASASNAAEWAVRKLNEEAARRVRRADYACREERLGLVPTEALIMALRQRSVGLIVAMLTVDESGTKYEGGVDKFTLSFKGSPPIMAALTAAMGSMLKDHIEDGGTDARLVVVS